MNCSGYYVPPMVLLVFGLSCFALGFALMGLLMSVVRRADG